MRARICGGPGSATTQAYPAEPNLPMRFLTPSPFITRAETWRAGLEKLKAGRLLGRFFAASQVRLREVAAHLGVHHVANLRGCPAR